MPSLREIIDAFIQIESRKEPSNEKISDLKKLFWEKSTKSQVKQLKVLIAMKMIEINREIACAKRLG